MKDFDIIHFLQSKGVIGARLYEEGIHQRVFLNVKGVSKGGHDTEGMYIEYVDNPSGTFWLIGNSAIPFRSEDLEGITFLDFKFALM